MAVGAITKQSVDRLAPKVRPADGKLVEDQLWDAKLSGFGVKVTPKGSKSYFVQYRMGGRGSPTNRVTIGAHGAPWTPQSAREKAEEILSFVKNKVDPQERKKAEQREAVDLAFDKYANRFLSNYGERHWSEGTLEDNRRYLTADGAPAPTILGRKPLPKVTRSDIAAVFDEVAANKAGYARNLYSVLRKLFGWAVERGDIERSPMEGFKGPKPVAARDRVLTDSELRLAWLTAPDLGYPFGPLHRLLIATGQRREEVASLEWKHLNRATSTWNMPASKAKNDKAHTVPLNALALALLDAIAGGDDWPIKGFVFSTTGKTAASGFSKAKKRLDDLMLKAARKEAEERGRKPEDVEIDPWRVHDLRRTFATGMQRLGVRFEVTEAILNHVSGSRSGVAGVYQRHDWADEKRTALDAWAQHLSALLEPASRSNVVNIVGDAA